MLKIVHFSCEGVEQNCITDREKPAFSFMLESDLDGSEIEKATLRVNGWVLETTDQIALEYRGPDLEPFSSYKAELEVIDNHGQTAHQTLEFETGRLRTGWQADWITDGSYIFTKKKGVAKTHDLSKDLFRSEKNTIREDLFNRPGDLQSCTERQAHRTRLFCAGFYILQNEFAVSGL